MGKNERKLHVISPKKKQERVLLKKLNGDLKKRVSRLMKGVLLRINHILVLLRAIHAMFCGA